MKITNSEMDTELSYFDLMCGLVTDVATDMSMPNDVKDEVSKKLVDVYNMLAPYSA